MRQRLEFGLEDLLWWLHLDSSGDIEGEGIRELISQQYKTEGTVVMAPHHGSPTEETKDFIQWSDPILCVISGRRRPNEKLLLNLLNSEKIPSVFTHRDHAIRVRLFADGTQSYQRWNHNSGKSS